MSAVWVRPIIAVALIIASSTVATASNDSHEPTPKPKKPCPAADAIRPSAELHRKAYGHHFAISGRFTLQNDWSQDHATASSIGIGFTTHIFAIHFGPVALGIEAGADFLFREGDMKIPVEVALKTFFETQTYAEPYVGFGPVVSVDFGGETEIHYGGALSFGVALHSTRLLGFFIEGTYRWLAGHAFQQQLAFSLGPFFCF